jgi:hypothetical protein
MSDIDIDSPSEIQREGRTIIQKNPAARDIPPNHCSQQFYYSKFKGGLKKHRDVNEKNMAHPSSCQVHLL